MKGNYAFMFEKLRNKAMIIDDRIESIGEAMTKRNAIQHLHNVRSPQSVSSENFLPLPPPDPLEMRND